MIRCYFYTQNLGGDAMYGIVWGFFFMLVAIPMLAISVGIALVIFSWFDRISKDLFFKRYRK